MSSEALPSPLDAADDQPARRAAAVTATVYMFATLSMATIGTLVPFLGPLARDLRTSGIELGLGIALFSIPSAILATIGGVLMDRAGLKRAIVASGLACACGDLVVREAARVWQFDAGLIISGIGLAGAAIGTPAMLMASLAGRARTRALAFCSSFAPTGFAFGLLLSMPFAAVGAWRAALLLHLALALAVTLLGAAVLPVVGRVPPRAKAAAGGGVLALLRHGAALRLGATVALPNGIAYGTSLVAPSYLARVHGVSLATSTGGVAAAKIMAMLFGAVLTGQLLVSRRRPALVFTVMIGIGIVAQLVFFSPLSPFALALGALILWLFAFGGISGVVMAMLPAAVPDRARGGAAAGLVNQMISIVSFAAPSTYFAMHAWSAYVALGVCGLLCSLALLPRLRLGA